jgi:hypothetical protein
MTAGTQIALFVMACYGLIALVVGPVLRRKEQREVDATLIAREEYRRWYAEIEASDARLRS